VYSVRAADVTSQLCSKPTRVFLVGDAAHATTTHMGMGANTAFADAADLAAVLASSAVADWPSALAVNEKNMVARAVKVVEGSVGSTNMIHAAGVFGQYVRPTMLRCLGFAMRVLPASVFQQRK
jgi:2-polyprenyl-6-methoxyphenol hydroxylase-like FAD-dependent oxidoreductase